MSDRFDADSAMTVDFLDLSRLCNTLGQLFAFPGAGGSSVLSAARRTDCEAWSRF